MVCWTCVWKSEVNSSRVFLCCFPHFLRQGLSLNLGLVISARLPSWPASHGIHRSLLARASVTDVPHIWLLCGCWRSELRSSCLSTKHFTRLTISLAHKFLFLKLLIKCFLFYMYVFCLHICKCTTCLSSTQGGSLIPWDWKVQMVVIHCGGTGNHTRGPL